MKRTAILTAFLLVIAHTAAAGPNWQVGAFTMDPANLEQLVAATDKLMGGEVGQSMPGNVALMASVIDGSDPATNSYITSFQSVADRESFISKLRETPEWAEFGKVYSAIAEAGSTSRMNLTKSWGEGGDEDVVWQLHAFRVDDADEFTEALDTLMSSDSGESFPGQLHLSAVAAAGITQSTHIVAVGFQSEAEAEAWTDKLRTTKDWAKYFKASRKVAKFQGTFIIRTIKSWGAPPE